MHSGQDATPVANREPPENALNETNPPHLIIILGENKTSLPRINHRSKPGQTTRSLNPERQKEEEGRKDYLSGTKGGGGRRRPWRWLWSSRNPSPWLGSTRPRPYPLVVFKINLCKKRRGREKRARKEKPQQAKELDWPPETFNGLDCFWWVEEEGVRRAPGDGNKQRKCNLPSRTMVMFSCFLPMTGQKTHE